VGLYFGGWIFELVLGRFLGEISKDELRRRVREVRDFERMLAADGSVIRKLWIHTSKKQLGKRLERLDKKQHGWLAAERDRRIHENYDELVPLAEELVAETDLPHAPWIVVEGKDDEFRDLTVMEVVRDAMTAGPCAPIARPPAPEPVPLAGRLEGVDLTASMPEGEYEQRLDTAQARLADLSYRAAEEGQATVLAFEGWDAAGKGGAIRRMTRAMAARDYRVVPVAAPTDEEHAHHYLWRFWRDVPRAGRMTIFDRSWYGRVLVERVEGLASESEWTRAYAEIRHFEEMLMENGAPLRKFWLHIDADEQLRRFEAREKTPYKKYKLTEDDYRNREKWDDYVAAIDEMVDRTSTPAAPWHLIPANDKRVARIKVLEIVCGALEEAL